MNFIRALIVIFIYIVHFNEASSYYFGQFGHLVIDPANRNEGNWNADGEGRSRENRYSLRWDEEVCRSRGPYEIGYFKSSDMDPSNPEGAFSAKLWLRHAFYNPVLYKFPFDWRGACSSWQPNGNHFTITNGAYCSYSGAYNVCFDSMLAPYSKRSLYPWMAKIYLGVKFEGNETKMNEFLKNDTNGKKIFQVLEGNQEMIDAGYEKFDGIDVDESRMRSWMKKIRDDKNFAKRYMADNFGRRMVCARIIGGQSSSDVCGIEGACLEAKSLDRLIKCIIVPLGPPPPPFTPYIVGDLQVFTVPHTSSTYLNPVVRISYYKNKKREFNNCGALVKGSNTCKFDNYEINIELGDDKICTTLFKIGSKTINLSLGCQDRGDRPIPKLEAVKPKSGSMENVNLKITYPWASSTEFATIQPIDGVKYSAIGDISGMTALVKDLDYKLDGTNILTAFQVGFSRNPNSRIKSFDSFLKKMCRYQGLDSSGLPTITIRYIDLYDKCEDLDEMVTSKNVNLHTCNTTITAIPIYVKNPSDCIREGLLEDTSKPVFQGIECKNGNLIKKTDKCQDIISNIFYEQDGDGKKVCLRGYKTGREAYLMPKIESDGTKKIIRFISNDKVLMELDNNGKIDFNKPFRSLNQIPQDELDFYQRLSETEFLYKKDNEQINYIYGAKVLRVGSSETSFVDYNSQPFVLDDGDVMKYGTYEDIDINNMCIPTNYIAPQEKEWNYILQIPGYYANYDIKVEDSDSDINPLKTRLTNLNGGILMSDLANDKSKLDSYQSKALLVPTDFVSSPNITKDAIIGMIDHSENRIAQTSKLQSVIHNSFKFDFGSFNFYSDFINKIVKANKVAYIDGKNLAKENDNLFDTSKCDTIDFEIWSGGTSSNANQGTNSPVFDFTTASNPSVICNVNSPGKNGGYLKGRFHIRHNSKIRILVGSSIGNETSTSYKANSGSSEIVNMQNLAKSDIWITDSVDGHVKIASTDSVSAGHDCLTNPNCNNNDEDDLTKNAINGGLSLVQKDDNSLSKFFRYGIGGDFIKGLVKKIIPNNLNEEEIQIDQYRGVSMSSYCGGNVISGKADLFSTLPLSYPVNTNKYIEDNDPLNINGYDINKSLLNLTKAGSGDFSEIGSYFFTNISNADSASGNSFGFNIDWSKRPSGSIIDRKTSKCESRIKACFNLRNRLSGNMMIYGGNASGLVDNFGNFEDILTSDSIDNNIVKNLVTDMNIYCPGMGGCYFNDSTKGISQSGTNGLAKVRCFRS